MEKVVMEEGISTNINNRQYIMKGPVLKIHRLRYANDILLKDETRYISMVLCPKINIRDFEGTSLMTTYEKDYNLKLTNVERTLGNTILHPNDQRNYFENEVTMAVFILDGAIFSEGDKIVEIEQSYYRGDKYKFTVTAKPQLSIR